MYVTRPLSRYLADPKAAAEPPPEGPGSGFLVVVDEATEQASTRCCGMCLDRELRGLPFPQNRGLVLREGDANSNLETFSKCVDCFVAIIDTGGDDGGAPGAGNIPEYVLLVPVVGEPLSSCRYYVVRGADGKHTGKVSACSREEDKTACCFCSCVKDAKPRAFDRADVYQQVEVQQLPSGSSGSNKGFKAVAVATDGIPPGYLRNKGWKVSTIPASSRDGDDLADDAHGVDSALRRRMPPDLAGGAEGMSSPPAVVVVGRWYVPFMFVKADGEYRRLKDQFRKCKFYQMTMEQSWEQIYTHTRRRQDSSEPAAEVTVTATVRWATALLGGTGGAVQEAGGPQVEGGAVWFRPAAATVVALDTVVWERMRWEVERGGWVAAGGDGAGEERIERVERRDDGQWRQFGCYLLVERFVLRRMDGSVALTCEFRHTDKIRTKWWV